MFPLGDILGACFGGAMQLAQTAEAGVRNGVGWLFSADDPGVTRNGNVYPTTIDFVIGGAGDVISGGVEGVSEVLPNLGNTLGNMLPGVGVVGFGGFGDGFSGLGGGFDRQIRDVMLGCGEWAKDCGVQAVALSEEIRPSLFTGIAPVRDQGFGILS